MLLDPEQKIARPRQLYVGHGEREVVPIEKRAERLLAQVGVR
jgi:citrate synthase